MSDDLDETLRAELLDDFYAECDEHLSLLRAQLTAAENAPSGSPQRVTALEACFRSMHSLKGNAAIVGLRPAERLAHAAEEQLRRLGREPLALPAEGLDALGLAVQRLEEIVGAHRLGQTVPMIDDLLETLGGAPGVATERPSDPGPTTPPTGSDSRWRCLFSPSAELDQRGININTVRARLAGIGRIVQATPIIVPEGAVRFEFTVAVRELPTDLGSWKADGLEFSPAGPEVPAAGAPAVEPSSTPSSSSLFVSPSHLVRVDLGRLDELMRITGEMVIHRSRLEERIRGQTGDRTPLQEVNQALARSLRELRDALTRVRLVPVAEIFGRLPFVVRDLARESGKRVELVAEGQQTEIDKYLVERLKEPLLHLVRNAVTHAVETPAERRAAGKAESATLVLRAAAVGTSVIIQVRDDGRGVDGPAVAARAAAAGIHVPPILDDHALLGLLCHPGFSTRDEADRGAGRGVGMAVVQNTVRELGGSLSLSTRLGQGTQFSLRLPLTLSIAETFIVSVAGQTCAIPQEFVREVLSLAPDQVRRINRMEVMPHGDGVLPLYRARLLVGVADPGPTSSPVLILTTDRGEFGLLVDQILGRREVVVRAMQDPLIQVRGVSGATELGDGRPVLILDPTELAAGVLRSATPRHVLLPA